MSLLYLVKLTMYCRQYVVTKIEISACLLSMETSTIKLKLLTFCAVWSEFTFNGCTWLVIVHFQWLESAFGTVCRPTLPQLRR